MKAFAISLALVAAAAVFGTQGPSQTPPARSAQPVRIPVYHADPHFIVAMLEGRRVASPELSVIFNLMGAPPAAGQAASQPLFTGGKLIVNPVDNSIWFYPDR